MFSGEFSHNIDAKGRLIVPARFRELLGDTFVITKGFEGCLFAYSAEEWEKVAQKLSRLPSNQANARRIQRTFLSGAAPCETDKQGRILIPATLRAHAALTRDVTVIGAYNRVEIWDSGRWSEYLSAEDAITLEEAAEALDDIDF